MRPVNNHHLKRWLMREVHGVEIPRKPPKKATHSTGKPPRNARYRAWIRSLPCASCGIEPAGEAAHTGSDGGMSQKSSDYSCVPLCSQCHTQSADALSECLPRGIGKTAQSGMVSSGDQGKMPMMTRDEHLAWCKKRALEYLDAGDLLEAFTSMGSDLSKHPELRNIGQMMFPVGMLYVQQHDARQLRRWIEGFN